MIRPGRALLLLVLLGSLLPLTGSWADPAAKPSEAEIAAIEAQKAKERAALDAQKKQTGSKLKEVRQARRAVLGEVNSIDSDLLQVRSRLERLQAELQRQQEELTRARNQHDRYATEYEAAQRRFGHRLRVWYKQQRTPLAAFYFTTRDVNDFHAKLHYAEAALRADRTTIEFLQTQRQLLEGSQAALAQETERTAELARQVDTERAQFQQLRNAKASVLSDIEKDVRKLERAYAELEQSSREIEYFLASLKGGGSALFTGTFIHPLPGRPLTSGFGYRRHPILKRRKMHTGIDLSAPAGTPVRSAAAGTVVFADWKNGYGKCVIVNHGKGFSTLYAHFSTIHVRVGQDIAQGTVVGGVGSTGMSTGNHLHFEIRINGKPVNPLPYI